MPTNVRRVLIACFFVFPSLVFAAENTAPIKPVALLKSSEPAAPETTTKPAATTQPTRIGYVDIARIGTESERGKALKSLLTAKKDKFQEKINGKKKQLDKLKASIEAKIATLTQPQREAKSKEFQKKVEEFQKFAQASEEELLALQDRDQSAL